MNYIMRTVGVVVVSKSGRVTDLTELFKSFVFQFICLIIFI